MRSTSTGLAVWFVLLVGCDGGPPPDADSASASTTGSPRLRFDGSDFWSSRRTWRWVAVDNAAAAADARVVVRSPNRLGRLVHEHADRLDERGDGLGAVYANVALLRAVVVTLAVVDGAEPPAVELEVVLDTGGRSRIATVYENPDRVGLDALCGDIPAAAAVTEFGAPIELVTIDGVAIRLEPESR